MVEVNLVRLHDRGELERFLRRNPVRHLYELGDLDDAFFPLTEWWGWKNRGELVDVALLYNAFSLSIFIWFTESGVEAKPFFRELLPQLPERMYCHILPETQSLLASRYNIISFGSHFRMQLSDPSLATAVNTDETVPLRNTHREALEELYRDSYSGVWFDPTMLDTNQFFGVYREGKLVAAAGVHVYSLQQRAAAIASVAVRPEFRGQGLCRIVTAKVCQSLFTGMDTIGLSVEVANKPAIQCYQSLGFTTVNVYEEYEANRVEEIC